MINRTFFSIPIIFLLLVSCGFKVVNQSDLANFSITNINMNGEKRINYYLKNTLSFSAKNNKNVNPISLNIVSQKNKNIKEKNIKNEITKYAIEIIVSVELINANNKSKTIQVREIGDYSVAAQHSQTLNNEKNLIKTMSDTLANIILKKLTTVIDDL